MELPYGTTNKTIKGKKYVYFWFYQLGTGRRTDVYLGRADKPATHKRGIQAKLEYLQGLQKELDLAVEAAKIELSEVSL